jgi:hypothetical protein
MFPWQRLGKHVPVATATLTDSRGNDSVNTFPAQRLDEHLPGATTQLTRCRGNDSVSTSVQNGQNRKSNIFRRNVFVDTNTHRTIEEMNGAVLPIQSAEKLYKECRNARRYSGWLAFPENYLVNFLWKRLGKHVPGATDW